MKIPNQVANLWFSSLIIKKCSGVIFISFPEWNFLGVGTSYCMVGVFDNYMEHFNKDSYVG
jgi:hypothetical protein